MMEIRVDKYVFARRLVVRLNTGQVHSFALMKLGSGFQDKPAMQAACDFIQSKIKPNRLEPLNRPTSKNCTRPASSPLACGWHSGGRHRRAAAGRFPFAADRLLERDGLRRFQFGSWLFLTGKGNL